MRGRGGGRAAHDRRLAVAAPLAHRNWDFPKGLIGPGEAPRAAAVREVCEEAGIDDLAFSRGEAYRETAPYAGNRVARYYLAESRVEAVTLPVSSGLGRPEHHASRWVTPAEAERLLPARLQPILAWARSLLAA